MAAPNGRRSFDFIKPDSEDSLADWSQKIRSLQQQVDEEASNEQRRLEDEIQRSRLERARRRSTLTGNARVDQGKYCQTDLIEAL